jgi:hypothetical protein
MVANPVVVPDSGLRRNIRPGQNHKSKNSEQGGAEYLHNE